MTSKTSKLTQNASGTKEHSREDIAAAIEMQGLRPLDLPATITIQHLAGLMEANPVDIIKELMRRGYMYTINEVIEHDVAASVAAPLGFGVLPLAKPDLGPGSIVVSKEDEDQNKLQIRPPVITILGHVDHGKTTLLDRIRNTNVVEKEAGGITQHVGAYQIEYEGTIITFLDTPGHAAFTAMRARGAQVTDIAVLVVAADDGIMPQTIEAINHGRAAGVPIVVAINKIDAPNADVERVKRQLSEQNLLIEEWGGEVIAVEISALKGEGVPELLENLVLVAEVDELRANPDRDALGVVVEARKERGRGTVATLLIQTGSLRVGDFIVADGIRGRVKAMFDDQGRKIEIAGPSFPVEVLGLNDLPEAGMIFLTAPNDKTAKQMVDQFERSRIDSRTSGITLEDVHTRIEMGQVKALNLIIKTDVQGTVEAVRGALDQLASDEARVNIVHAASGSITEPDVLLAVASQAIVIGFNTHAEPGALTLASQESVDIRAYQVIYHLIEDIAQSLDGLLDPVYKDVLEGRCTVRAVFNLGRNARVAGVYVNDGSINRGATLRLIRSGNELISGTVGSLKHFKDDVREIGNGFEGGITIEGFNDYQEGDIIEAYRSEQVR